MLSRHPVATPGGRRRAALAALGWHPAVLVELVLFGARLLVGADPDPVEIHRRLALGLGPMTDPRSLRHRLDHDPDFAARPAPVRLVGALADRASWPAARGAIGLFTAFGPRAVLVPAAACTPVALIEAAVTGVGVLRYAGTAGQDAVTRIAMPAPMPAGPDRI